MENRIWALLSAGALILCGCNGIGDKDNLLAKINDEKVYEEDVAYFDKDPSVKHRDRRIALYEKVFGEAALVSEALKKYPDLDSEWLTHYKDVDAQILTMVYQRYFVMENLTYTDSELRNFYDSHRNLFAGDSGFVISHVAEEYCVSKNEADWKAFLEESFYGVKDPTASDTATLKTRFADRMRKNLRNTVTEQVRKESPIVINPLPVMDAGEYYNRHKDEFVTEPGYEVYQIGNTDSLKLAELFADGATVDEFKAMAVKLDKNPWLAKDSGYVGKIKKGHAIPYGIGLLPALDNALEGKTAGFITPVIYSESDKQFHRFYLVSTIPSEVKPLDRVMPGVKALLTAGDWFDIDSSFVVMSQNGKPLFTVKDILRLNELFFHAKMNMKNLSSITKVLYESYSFAEAARRQQLDKGWIYRAVVRKARNEFINERYMERELAVTVSDDSLKALYDRIGSPIHPGYDFEKAKEDLLQVAAFPENLYKHEYYMCYRVIYAGKTYEQSIPLIFAHREKEVKEWAKKLHTFRAYTAASRHFYDLNMDEYVPDLTPSSMIAKADSLRDSGNRSGAYQTLRMLMYLYPNDNELFPKIAFEMAQLQADNEEFLDAEGEYYAFYTMWPNSPDVEKALFSRGFILNENLKNDSLALVVLEEFQQKFPKSELKESVDWLVENIKSNGKLADDLLKKIESEE